MLATSLCFSGCTIFSVHDQVEDGYHHSHGHQGSKHGQSYISAGDFGKSLAGDLMVCTLMVGTLVTFGLVNSLVHSATQKKKKKVMKDTIQAVAPLEEQPSGKKEKSVPATDEPQNDIATTPIQEREALGHYNSEIPTVNPTTYTDKNNATQVGTTFSALYVFDSGIDLQSHTGWGGVVELFVEHRKLDKSWYARMSTDFMMFSTTANTWRDGARFHETIDAGQMHFNLGGGFCYGPFDFGLEVGLGGGITRTANTHYNNPDRTYTLDASAQLMLRLTWNPVDWCSAFIGYRGFWLVPVGGRYDEEERLAHKALGEPTSFPTLSIQCVEAGVSFRF